MCAGTRAATRPGPTVRDPFRTMLRGSGSYPRHRPALDHRLLLPVSAEAKVKVRLGRQPAPPGAPKLKGKAPAMTFHTPTAASRHTDDNHHHPHSGCAPIPADLERVWTLAEQARMAQELAD